MKIQQLIIFEQKNVLLDTMIIMTKNVDLVLNN